MLGRVTGRHEQARAASQRLVEQRPDLYYGYAERGLSKLAQGHAEQALDDLRQAAQVSPYLAQAHLNVAMACIQIEAWREATGALKRALTLGLDDEASNLIARYRLYRAELALGDVDRAQHTLRHLRRRKRQVGYWLDDLAGDKGSKMQQEDRKLAREIMAAITST